MFKVELEAIFNRVGEQLTLDRETTFGETPVHIHGVIRNTAGVVYSDATLETEPHTDSVLPDLVLDLDALAEEDVVLNLPSKVLCKEDCKGLCPQCGKNLNDGPCDCKEPVDPRLAGLLDLLN